MNNKDLRFTKLKTQLSQHINKIYQSHLAHKPGAITYKLFPDKLIIVIEDSVTQPEKLLNQSNKKQLAKEVRTVLDQIFQIQFKELIEQSMEVTIADFLLDTTIRTGRTGAIAIFDLEPKPLALANCDEKD